MSEWQTTREAMPLRYGTVADLRMDTGRVYRAVWGFRGNCCAWWPQAACRKRPIGSSSPVEVRILAVGMVDATDWEEGARVNHAALPSPPKGE